MGFEVAAAAAVTVRRTTALKNTRFCGDGAALTWKCVEEFVLGPLRVDGSRNDDVSLERVYAARRSAACLWPLL
jgi:hypothetical protein